MVALHFNGDVFVPAREQCFFQMTLDPRDDLYTVFRSHKKNSHCILSVR